MHKPLFVLSQEDWSLHRKGELDQQRHQRKVREAIKRNLSDLVSEESIITSQGDRIVKVPIRSLDEPSSAMTSRINSWSVKATAERRQAM